MDEANRDELQLNWSDTLQWRQMDGIQLFGSKRGPVGNSKLWRYICGVVKPLSPAFVYVMTCLSELIKYITLKPIM